jgi:hypothetical protein
MTDTRRIKLGGQAFDVPALPLRLNMKAYPLCRKLGAAGLIERIAASGGQLDCTADEMVDLVELTFLGVTAADPTVKRETFDELTVTPPELLDAFLVLRYQTGGWVPMPAEGEHGAGEAPGAKKPPK